LEEIQTGKSFSDVGAFAIGMENLTLSGSAEPEVLKAARVSANFLSILGVKPLLGRSFLPEEDTPGGAPVVIISAGLWQRRLHGDPHAVGKTLSLAGAPHVVIGALPTGFEFPFPQVDVWVTKPSEWSAMSPQSRRISPFLTVFGRLQPGVSLDQASAELAVIQHRHAASHPAMLDAKTKGPVRARLWKDELVSRAGSILWMLFGAVAFVLLIACANVASLLLARASSRMREFALRSALGASRARLIGQMLVESVLLSILGVAFGILRRLDSPCCIADQCFGSSASGRDSLGQHGAWIYCNVIRRHWNTVRSRAFTASVAAGPPVRLEDRQRSGGGDDAKIRVGLTAGGVLVIGQVTLSIVLLIGASLLIESVMYLREIKPGFNPERLLTTQITLPPLRYNSDRKRMEFLKNSYAVWNQYPAFKAPQQR